MSSNQQRPLDSGRRDTLGRRVMVSGATVGGRAVAPPPPSKAGLEGRDELIDAGRFAEALAVSSAKPWPARDASSWWSNRKLIGEHNHAGGDYPMLPEVGLYHTQMRTRRGYYKGGDVEIRMPEKAAVRRFAGQVGGTFDMPVEVVTGEGPVSTNLRMTQVADGVWHVTPTTKDPTRAEVAAAEAVRAVMEGQRPALALETIGDLVARAESRVPVGAVRRKPVESSFINAVGFGRRTPVVTIEMNGRTYGYRPEASVAEGFLNAIRQGQSVGMAYSWFIKGQPRVEMKVCSRCGVEVPRGDGLPSHVCELHQRRDQVADRVR